jgi:hypothetical protein
MAYDKKSLGDFHERLRLNSMAMYEPSEASLFSAMRDLPVVLKDMETDPELASLDARASEILVFAEILIRLLGSRGHRPCAGAWAIYRLIERGKLFAEVRDVEPPKEPAVEVTRRLSDGSIEVRTEPSWVRPCFIDEKGVKRCQCLVVWARPELWVWSNDQVAARPGMALADDPRESSHKVQWPPPIGWGFRPGQFSYSGKIHGLSGRPWELLRLLAEGEDCPLTINELRKGLDDGYGIEDVTIRGYISELRKTLRDRLRLPAEHDPIPRVALGTYSLQMPEGF